MSVGSEGAYDFILQDTENNPTVELGLVLAYNDDDHRKTWAEGRIPPIPPRRSEGSLDWTHKDPISDFVFSQSDWSGGAFKPYYDPSDPIRYAKSNGVDLRWEGVAALGPRRGPIRTGGTVKSKIQSNVFIANGDWRKDKLLDGLLELVLRLLSKVARCAQVTIVPKPLLRKVQVRVQLFRNQCPTPPSTDQDKSK